MMNIDFESLRTIGLTHAVVSQLHSLPHAADSDKLARVVAIHRDSVLVHDGSGAVPAMSTHRLLQAMAHDGDSLAVGDWVTLATSDGRVWITARMAPLTQLARRSADGRRQCLASNVDTALLVMGLDHDFKLRRLERYLAMVLAAGVAPVVVLTKADVGTGVDDKLDAIGRRLPATVPVLAVNGLDPATPERLAPWLAPGQTLILLGSSGAGKSTLTNALAGAGQQTGGVRADDSRGRHTTTVRSLHLCAQGACIIDTPGLRSLSPDLDEAGLAASFEDIDALAAQCQFRDCAHEAEPGCAVRGAIDADRLCNYRKLLREALRHDMTPRDRIAQASKWKVLMKAAGERGRHKRGE